MNFDFEFHLLESQHPLLQWHNVGCIANIYLSGIDITYDDYDLLSSIAEGEGCCCVPIINQHFWCFLICLLTAHEQHTFGRGPAGVESSVLTQGVSFLPVAAIECNTRCFLGSATSTSVTSTTGDEAYIWEGRCRKELLMQESSLNLTHLGASTELISCANVLKFKTLTVYGTLLSLTWWESVSLEWSNTSSKKGNNFGWKLAITPIFCTLFGVQSTFLS